MPLPTCFEVSSPQVSNKKELSEVNDKKLAELRLRNLALLFLHTNHKSCDSHSLTKGRMKLVTK